MIIMPLRRVLKTLLWSQRRLFMWVLLFGVIILCWAFFQRQPIIKHQSTFVKCSEERAAVAQLEEEIRTLETQRQLLKEGGSEHVQVARQRYRLSKPGEYVLYLEPAPESDESMHLQPALP
jgi:cell division protein FtsB